MWLNEVCPNWQSLSVDPDLTDPTILSPRQLTIEASLPQTTVAKLHLNVEPVKPRHTWYGKLNAEVH